MEKPIRKLEASAGSGKTYRLALEYLGRLMRAFAGPAGRTIDARRQRELLGSVLAITFTVKAAQEMKRRIMEKLKRFALRTQGRELDGQDAEFLQRLAAATGLSPERIVGLSGHLIDLVLASYDDFNVMTIDSLMSAMVKAVSPDLDLPADYEIAVDDRDELDARARATLAEEADRRWPDMRKTLEDYQRFYPYCGWKADEPLAEKLIELFRLHNQEGAIPEEETRDALEEAFRKDRDGFRRELDGLLALLAAAGGHVNSRVVNQGLRDEAAAFSWTGDNLYKLEKLLSRSFFRKADPQDLLRKNAAPDLAARVGAAQERMRAALQDLALGISRRKTLPYREFFPDFLDKWGKEKRTLFVTEFSRQLAERFEKWGEGGFPYLYLKMSDRFRHFLFDEFQDTSTMQFKALAPLIDEMLSHEDASLFIVGDRKQAIYRWRGGNSELMDEGRLRDLVPAVAIRAADGFSATLDRNWRSRRAIVEFNNDFWAPEGIARIAGDASLQQAIRENFRDSVQELPAGQQRQGGYVEISLRVEAADSGEGEAEEREDGAGALSAAHLDEIEAIIRRLVDGHGYRPADIAVLARKNSQVRDIVRRLGRRGIDTVSDRSLMLDSNPRVLEILSFLRFLDYPPDDLEFHAFISGEVFAAAARRVSEEERSAIRGESFIPRQGPLYKAFRELAPAYWRELIEPFFQSVGFLPPYDLFSDLCQAYRLYESFPDDTPFFLALGDALHGAEREGGYSIAGFFRRWDALAASEETPSVAIPENAPGVRVLTMHQSKGLEFPAVIVPLDQSREARADAVHWEGGRPYYINRALALVQDRLRQTLNQESIKGTVDLLNLLYVAFTRAEEALFVPLAVKGPLRPPPPEADGLVARVTRTSDVVCRHPALDWLAGNTAPLVRGRLERKPGTGQAPTPPRTVGSKRTSTRSWQSRYLVFRRSAPEQRRDRAGAERGERVHDLLSRLGPVGNREQLESRVKQLATDAGWPESERDALCAFLLREKAFALLSRPGEVHAEKEVMIRSGPLPDVRRLDRLQAGPEEVLVIDFKTGAEKNEDHEIQVRGYMDAVGPLFPGRRCRGFLLYVDRGEVEEVPCSS